MIPQGLFEGFCRDHGAHVLVGSWFLFEDGAQLSHTTGQVFDAPIPGTQEHYVARRKYLQVLLSAAQREFEQLRNNMSALAAQYEREGWQMPYDWEQSMEQLKTLKEILAERQAEFDRHTEPERQVQAQATVCVDEEEIRRAHKREVARQALDALSQF